MAAGSGVLRDGTMGSTRGSVTAHEVPPEGGASEGLDGAARLGVEYAPADQLLGQLGR